MEYSFPPLISTESKILILGSLPGVKSLQKKEYYAHPQNQFWKIMFAIFDRPFSENYSIKQILLRDNHIALWDVVKCAEREGSSDCSIKNQVPNDVPELLYSHPNINFIIFNGGCAFKSFKKYFGEPAISYGRLLSTSPACAGRDREKAEMWERAIKEGLAIR